MRAKIDEGEAQATAGLAIRSFMERLAALLRPSFPAHSSALSVEITGTRLTTERWHRIANVLSALNAMPGVELREHEHIVRNIALAAAVVAQQMAIASFGLHDPPGRRWLALGIATDLDVRISRAQAAPSKEERE